MSKIKTDKKPYILLRSKMLEHGIDQINLGKLLGVNKTTINRKLNKKMEFTRDDMVCIKNYFKLTPDETVTIFLND